ncbi:MAG: hypothetical protein CFE26_23275, partial [Verrucomicrobiales bacterium VVV1]
MKSSTLRTAFLSGTALLVLVVPAGAFAAEADAEAVAADIAETSETTETDGGEIMGYGKGEVRQVTEIGAADIQLPTAG